MSDVDDDGLDVDQSNQFLASMSSLEGGKRRFLHGTDASQFLVIFESVTKLSNRIYQNGLSNHLSELVILTLISCMF